MPYRPTGNPPGRPRKQFEPPSARVFISGTAPALPQAAVDTTIPKMGQRKRVKQRRPQLHPTPVKA